MKSARAWAVIAVLPEDRQYAGNLGHPENIRELYRYDKDVPNHMQVSTGDLFFIRDKQKMLGVARVQSISSEEATKIRQRCPVCGNVYVKERKFALPRWRCTKGHTFEKPLQDPVLTTRFTASFGSSFVEALAAIGLSDLKAAAPRPNDQLSIEEIDVGRLAKALAAVPLPIRRLVVEFLQGDTLAGTDADEPNISLPNPGEPPADDPDSFVSDGVDRRTKVLKEIRLRRGQRAFRDKLRKRFKDECVVTGCPLVDLLEAAHIDPYRGADDNHPGNGLLLRADVHTLFDLYLMGIDPVSFKARFHPKALFGEYAALDGKTLFSGTKPPSIGVLAKHWALFLKTCGT